MAATFYVQGCQKKRKGAPLLSMRAWHGQDPLNVRYPVDDDPTEKSFWKTCFSFERRTVTVPHFFPTTVYIMAGKRTGLPLAVRGKRGKGPPVYHLSVLSVARRASTHTPLFPESPALPRFSQVLMSLSYTFCLAWFFSFFLRERGDRYIGRLRISSHPFLCKNAI